MEVLNERVRDEEACEGGAHRSNSVPATKVELGESGEVEAEEPGEGVVGCSVGCERRCMDVGQCFAGRMDGS